MLEEAFWKKRFSVGLAMHTSLKEYESFLRRYSAYIDNVYVSLPLGDRFHGREYIREQFHASEKVDLFWRLLDLIQTYEVSVEVVFNTNGLVPSDFWLCREALEKHRVKVKKTAVLEAYFDQVREFFPEAAIVKSVNHMPNCPEDFKEIRKDYDEVVVGRQFIRDSGVFSTIRREVGALPVLLVNNGCSFTCMGCREKNYCGRVYERDCGKTSPEYLYALQSILPYELHEGYFDISDVGLFKLSTRNADTDFTERCIDSYIHNNAEEYIKKKKFNYLLWARLQWHMDHFEEFDFERIRTLKRRICETKLRL